MTKQLPPIFYKYLGEETTDKFLLDMLKEKYMFFSDPETVNDIFDCSYSFDEEAIMDFPIKNETWGIIFSFLQEENIKTETIEIDTSAKTVGDIFSYLEKQVDESILQSIKKLLVNSLQNVKSPNRIYSMTEVNDSLLMWAHYGGHLKGSIMCFATQKEPRFFSKAEKITYSKDRCLTTYKVRLTKSLDWEYEREWRLISYAESDKNCHKTDSIVAVIMGKNVKISVAQDLLGFCSQNDMPLFIAEPDDKLFKINISPYYIPEPQSKYQSLIAEIAHTN